MANSPIDLPYNGVSIKRDWLPFQLLHYERHPYKMYLTNNGHTAVVTYDTATCYDIPTVIQGGLPSKIFLIRIGGGGLFTFFHVEMIFSDWTIT